MQLDFHEEGGKIVLSLENIGKENSEGWLTTTVCFDYKDFSARFPIYLMLNDIYPFFEQLEVLNKDLKGEANFTTIEGNIDLKLLTDGLGHIEINGKIRHGSDYSLETSFIIPSDQTFLNALLNQCKEILKNGKPA